MGGTSTGTPPALATARLYGWLLENASRSPSSLKVNTRAQTAISGGGSLMAAPIVGAKMFDNFAVTWWGSRARVVHLHAHTIRRDHRRRPRHVGRRRGRVVAPRRLQR